MLAIHTNPFGVWHLTPEDAIDQILDVIQAVSVLPDHRLFLRRENLQAGTFGGFLNLDLCHDSEVAEHGIEDFLGEF
jgi:hypothetical protein